MQALILAVDEETRKTLAKRKEEIENAEKQLQAIRSQIEKANSQARMQWSRTQETVHKPKPIEEKLLDWKVENMDLYRDEDGYHDFPETRNLEGDPPLYDSMSDRICQSTLELWLLRTDIAHSLRSWQAMESYSKAASAFAKKLNWDPLLARCNFPLGIALYHQEKWIEAAETFYRAEELDPGPKRYYLPEKKLAFWMKKASMKVQEPYSSVTYESSRVKPQLSVNIGSQAIDRSAIWANMPNTHPTGEHIRGHYQGNRHLRPAGGSVDLESNPEKIRRKVKESPRFYGSGLPGHHSRHSSLANSIATTSPPSTRPASPAIPTLSTSSVSGVNSDMLNDEFASSPNQSTPDQQTPASIVD